MSSDLIDNRSSFRFPLPVEKLEETGERYISGIPGDVQNEHYHRYLFALRYCTGKDVLDIASGEGYGSFLLSQTARTVVGVDVHRPAVDYANRTYLSDRVSYKHGDATAMPIADQSIDVVVSFETLEHFIDHQKFCDEVNRVLRPGGLLVISSPNRLIYTDAANHQNAFHLKELDRAEFDQLIAENFKNYALFVQRPMLGSVILADPAGRAAATVEGFETSDGLLFDRSNLADRVPYFIALASNGALPGLRSSVMHNPHHLDMLNIAHTAQTVTLAAVQAEVERLRVEEAGLIARLQEAHQAIEAQVAVTQAETAAKEAEAAARQAEVAARQADEIAKQAEIAALREAEAAARQADEIAKQAEIAALREAEAAARLADEIAKQAEIAALREAEAAARQAYEVVKQAEVAALGAEIETLNAEIARLGLDIERLDLERLVITQDLLAKAKQIEQDQVDAAQARLVQQAQVATIERALAETDQLGRRLKAQDEALRCLQVENLYLKSSLSWRMTAPLRSVVRRFPAPLRLLRRSVRTVRWAATGQLSAQLRIRWNLLKMRRVIKRSGLFDEPWYRVQYPEVAHGSIDPILQFLVDGAANGRDPGPNFSIKRYRWQNPDVAATGMNPLLHYILHGKAEGRAALPVPVRSSSGGAWISRSADEEYDDWIQSYDTLVPEDVAKIGAVIEAMAIKPLISVVMPVYNPPVVFLTRAIESVRQQLYPHWELCIADDASTDPAVAEVLTRFAALDERIKVRRRPVNGHISAASNTALELATGDYIALLDHDDELAAHALFCVAREIVQSPDIDILFSDEDKIDESGLRSTPYFKSGWNPDLMLSQNAFCHLGVFRRSLVEQIGGFRIGFEGSQDYDLVLRVSELTTPAQIRHIPRILYHWRMIQGSTATAGSEKPYAWLAGQRAIEEHLQRIGRPAKVLPAAGGAFYRVSYELPEEPLVSIIIPTRDGLDLLKGCITSLFDVSTYRNIEIIIVDNGSVEPATLEYLAELTKTGAARVMRDDGAFNYSRLNNAAAETATGEYLCLLNNDTVVISPDWLQEMVSLAARPGVGAVGAMLYYANDTIQHAGVVAGIGGIAGHVHRALPRGDFGYFGRAAVTQNLSIVTGACLLTSRAIYRELGGLNERDLTVAFNDVDYCLRLGAAGYRVVWTPFAELYHLESISRGTDEDGAKRKRFQQETDYMRSQWSEILAADPYYNPNLDLSSSNPRISMQPRLSPLSM